MADKEYIEAKDLDDFRNEIMDSFLSLCNYNDYSKLTLLRIGETIDKIYDKYVSKPLSVLTNADRIRAMSDEELADNWMRDFVVCHRCAYQYECECDEYVTYEKCKEGIVEWLKQPAEEV